MSEGLTSASYRVGQRRPGFLFECFCLKFRIITAYDFFKRSCKIISCGIRAYLEKHCK